MIKPDFSEILGKVKSSAGEVAKKVKNGVTEAAGKMKEASSEVIKAAREKIAKKTDVDEVNPKSIEKDENESKVKLDDMLNNAITQYNDVYTIMKDNGEKLYMERTRAVDMILHIEELVNSIANRPKDFDTEIAEIKTHRESFIGTCEFAKAELDAAKKSALGAGAGAATGVAIVSVAPTVAMWVATTFGTASTGTAISALSGAAATNAALAWLGGGALVAGGGGVAAGHAFLALAGPIGWSIAGVTLLSSIVLFKLNKLKLEKKKKEEIEAVTSNTASAQKVASQIQELYDEVSALRDNLNQQYNASLVNYGKDFMSISKEHQMQLGILVNNTKALATSLGKSI